MNLPNPVSITGCSSLEQYWRSASPGWKPSTQKAAQQYSRHIPENALLAQFLEEIEHVDAVRWHAHVTRSKGPGAANSALEFLRAAGIAWCSDDPCPVTAAAQEQLFQAADEKYFVVHAEIEQDVEDHDRYAHRHETCRLIETEQCRAVPSRNRNGNIIA